MIRDYIFDGRNNDRIERPSTIRKLAKTTGWWVGKEKIQGKILKFGSKGRLIASKKSLSELDGKGLYGVGGPLDVEGLARKYFGNCM
jgi:hypothetical protein